MRPGCLIPVLMVALTAAGCMHTSVPNGNAGQVAVSAASTDLDSIAYERGAAPPTTYAQAQPPGRPPAAAAQAYAQPAIAVAVPSPAEPPYALDTGDKLRIVVFGQDGLSNSYFVDAAGQVTIPLIGAITARGLTTQQLGRSIA